MPTLGQNACKQGYVCHCDSYKQSIAGTLLEASNINFKLSLKVRELQAFVIFMIVGRKQNE